MSTSLYVQALRRAAELLGGASQLRAYLRVSARELEAWMQGTEKPPTQVFLKAVDIVSGEKGGSPLDLAQKARNLRFKSDQVTEAARAVREKAAAAVELAAVAKARSARMIASLLGKAAAEVPEHRQASVGNYLATEFAPSDDSLILEGALNAAVKGTGAKRANIQLASPEGLHLVAHLGFKQPFLDFFAIVTDETPSCCGQAHQSTQRVIVADVATDPIFAGTVAGNVMQEADALAVQSTPLVGGSGEVIGMLSTHYQKPHQPSPEELAALDLICHRTSFWLAGNRPAA